MSKCIGIIPARFHSSRLPGKPLLKIGSKSMIELVYQKLTKAKNLDEIIIATDDKRIVEEAQKFGAQAIMTFRSHQSGTDRCAEVASDYWGDDIILNIQGDEPFIDPLLIDMLARKMLDDDWLQIGSLKTTIDDNRDITDPDVVKVVCDRNERALYFSRYGIPFQRDESIEKNVFFKHIGIYAFRNKILQEITALQPSRLEKMEKLEQLRWLENGYQMYVFPSNYKAFGIDTESDLERARRIIDDQK